MEQINTLHHQVIDWEKILTDFGLKHDAVLISTLDSIDWEQVLQQTTKKKIVNEDNIKEAVSILKCNFPKFNYKELLFKLYNQCFDGMECICGDLNNDTQKTIQVSVSYGNNNINGIGIINNNHNVDIIKYDQSRIQIGDIVKHFKQELLHSGDVLQNKYLYRVTDIAKHTETGETLIIYQALYYPFETFARPQSMFFELVDKNKYPNVNQKYRLEVLKRTNLAE